MGIQMTRQRWKLGIIALTMLLFTTVLIFLGTSYIEASSVKDALHQISALQVQPGQLDEASSAGEMHLKGLIDEFKRAEVIPDVLNAFAPLLTIDLSWPNFEADVGNTGKPSDMQDPPSVHLIDAAPDAWTKWWGTVWDGDHDVHHARPQLTLVMSDPDAPSRDDPSNSQFCHWIATGFPLTAGDARPSGDIAEMAHYTEIMPYRPPGPPPKTGKHRYVFAALVPKNATNEKLHLRAPEERAKWGFKHERDGVREWADEMGLSVIGANFFYAQNDEQ